MLNKIERMTWIAFKSVVNNFLGNHKAGDYKIVISKMLEAYNTRSP